MKEYLTPSLSEAIFAAEDVIALSSETNSIVSTGDAAVAAETQESTWDDSWN